MNKEKPYWRNTIILGLAGRKKVGKDTVADYLHGRYAGAVKINFSDVIIDEVNEMLTVHGLEVDSNDKEPWRRLLQEWGEFRRRQDEDYWNRKVEARLDAAIAARKKLVLVCGPRAIPEFEMVRVRGGELWKIIRPALESNDRNITEEILDIYSKFDRYILNDGTVERLAVKIDEALAEMVAEGAPPRDVDILKLGDSDRAARQH